MSASQAFVLRLMRKVQIRYWFKGSYLSLSLCIVRGQSLSAGDAHTAGFCVASWSFWTQQLPGGDRADLWLLGVWHADRGVVRSAAQGELSTHTETARDKEECADMDKCETEMCVFVSEWVLCGLSDALQRRSDGGFEVHSCREKCLPGSGPSARYDLKLEMILFLHLFIAVKTYAFYDGTLLNINMALIYLWSGL